MSEEKMSCLYELINGFEIVGTLTDDGRKLIKEGVQHLQQENKQLKDKLKGVQEERDYLFNKQSIENKYLALENNQLKEVIEEVREYNNQIIKDTKDFYRPTEDTIYSGDTLIDLAETNIQILDKAKENK